MYTHSHIQKQLRGMLIMGPRTTSAPQSYAWAEFTARNREGRRVGVEVDPTPGAANFRLVMFMGLRIIGWGSLIYRESNFISWLQAQANLWPQPDPYPTHT